MDACSSKYPLQQRVYDVEHVSVKVLAVDGGGDSKGMDDDISGFCLRGNIDGTPFVLSLGRQQSQVR